uniref:Uncharacterized protein n=1 Tax=Meloidogyne enterolobii TaxID=390850 RepID=A0A6V7UPY9_MELEN|nr:unnamed protein product [Meloidogyne enterolobii]
MSSTTFICIICSEPLTPNNMFSISCGHVFHEDCMTQIISQKKYCPKCRKVATLRDVRQIHLDNVQIKSESNKIKLNVREPSGNITVLEKIKSSDTIELIKCMVEMKIGIPPDQHRLIYMGKQLEDDRTIAYYDIEDGATIHLIMRLKGC